MLQHREIIAAQEKRDKDEREWQEKQAERDRQWRIEDREDIERRFREGESRKESLHSRRLLYQFLLTILSFVLGALGTKMLLN